jgi:hypothetical protein
MTTLLRHKFTSARGGKVVSVTAYPNDGRVVVETYRVSIEEARRFAWALLADLDPLEAAHAAAEDGLDLAALTQPRTASQPNVRGRRVDRDRPTVLTPPLEAARQALARLARAGPDGAVFSDLAQDMATLGSDSAQRAIVTRLMHGGFVQRANAPFRPARYAITAGGHRERARLDALAAAQDPQRSAA